MNKFPSIHLINTSIFPPIYPSTHPSFYRPFIHQPTHLVYSPMILHHPHIMAGRVDGPIDGQLFISFSFLFHRPSQLYKKWVSSGRSVSEEHHERLDTHSLSGLFFLGSSLVVASFIFLFFENRLYSAGFIYKDMQATETYKKGKRKFSTEVRKKLLLKRSKRQEEEKEETTELYPDISNYLHDRRRSNVMLTSMYNPKSTRSKYDLSPQTETTAV